MPKSIPARRVEVAVAAGANLGEAPLWVPREESLIWLDIGASRINYYDPRTNINASIEANGPLSTVSSSTTGALIGAAGHGFWWIDRETGELSAIAVIDSGVPARVQMNDGKVDVAGRYWAGMSSGFDHPQGASLYVLDSTSTVRPALKDVTVSNGLGWSPDDRYLYYIDSYLRRLDRFEFDADQGSLGSRRVVAEFPPARGVPDGLAVDADGCVWIAMWGGGSVCRLTPRGEVDLVVQVPSRLVTSCAFGGPDLTDMYITTAAGDNSTGHLYRCRPGPPGLPANDFLVVAASSTEGHSPEGSG